MKYINTSTTQIQIDCQNDNKCEYMYIDIQLVKRDKNP